MKRRHMSGVSTASDSTAHATALAQSTHRHSSCAEASASNAMRGTHTRIQARHWRAS